MRLQVFKAFHQNADFTEKEKLLFLENQELISENASIKQDLELKNKILKSIPHKLKNHITTLVGFSELLLNQRTGDLSDKQKRYLANIAESSWLLNTEVNNLLIKH